MQKKIESLWNWFIDSRQGGQTARRRCRSRLVAATRAPRRRPYHESIVNHGGIWESSLARFVALRSTALMHVSPMDSAVLNLFSIYHCRPGWSVMMVLIWEIFRFFFNALGGAYWPRRVVGGANCQHPFLTCQTLCPSDSCRLMICSESNFAQLLRSTWLLAPFYTTSA